MPRRLRRSPRVGGVTALAVLGPDGPVLQDPTAPVLRADDLGVLRGESVFETMRIAAKRPKTDVVVLCLSGRGDKDCAEVARLTAKPANGPA